MKYSNLYHRKTTTFTALLGLIFVVTTGNTFSADNNAPVPVTVAKVKHEQRNLVIKNSGRISNKNEIRLSFKTGGLIKSIQVEEGDFVKEGQVLATLDLEEMDAQHQRAASYYKQASDELARYSKLYDEKLISMQVKQNSQSAYDNASAELKIANFNRKLSVIRSPAAGRILKRHVESSELVKAGQSIFILASQKQGAVVRVGLIDQDIVKIDIGDISTIMLDAYPGRLFEGTVTEIAMSTVNNAGTFEVEISINDQGYSLRSGLIARVEIMPTLGERQYYIPIEAISRAKDGSAKIFVLVDNDQRVHEVLIENIELLKNEARVSGSLKATDKVIKLGAPYLSEGSYVSIQDNQ